MDSRENDTTHELALLIDFIQSVQIPGYERSPPVLQSEDEVQNSVVPPMSSGETILMPLAVQGLLSLLETSRSSRMERAVVPESLSTRFLERFVFASLNEGNRYKQVLSENGEKTLQTTQFSSKSALNTECPIFCTDFEEGQTVTKLPCNHCFVPEAIERWLRDEKAECPVCREKLPSKEVRTLDDEDTEDDMPELVEVTDHFRDPEEEQLELAILASMDNLTPNL